MTNACELVGFMRLEPGRERKVRRIKKAERYLENMDWFANGAGFDMIPRDFITEFCCDVS
jgi:hypothetical protein